MELRVTEENCLRTSDTAHLSISQVETETKKHKMVYPESIEVGITKLDLVS